MKTTKNPAPVANTEGAPSLSADTCNIHAEQEGPEQTTPTPATEAKPRRPGRPPGAKNKPKTKPTKRMIKSRRVVLIEPPAATEGTPPAAPRPIYRGIEARLQDALNEARGLQVPALKIQAIGMSQRALQLLDDFVTGKEEAPPAVRRLAAVDLLTIAGVISTNGQTPVQIPGGARPINDLTVDELRSLLETQRGTLDRLQKGLAGNVIEHSEACPQ
jgi:hypothetical protein